MSDRPGNRIPEPEDLGSLLGELARRRAEDIEQPQPQQAAERRAARAGKSIDELLAEDRARLRQSKYPGPECLEPYEVERYFLGALKPERMAHGNTCVACSALLHAAKPSESGAERIVEEVREAAQGLGRVFSVAKPVAVRERWWLRWLPKRRPVLQPGFAIRFSPAVGFLTDALAPVLLVSITVPAVFLLYPFTPPPREAPGVARAIAAITLPPALALSVLVPAVALTVVAAWVVARVRAWGAVLRESGGALIAGLVLAAVAGGFSWWDLGQRAQETQVGLTLVSARLAEVVAASLDVRRSTGEFPLVEGNPGTLALTTALRTPDRVVYRAHAKGLTGSLVAEVWPDGGAVYWQRAGESEQVGRLVLGTVDAVTPTGIVLRAPSGIRVTINAPPDDPMRTPGQEVLAIVTPRTSTATGIYPIASVMQIIPTAATGR